MGWGDILTQYSPHRCLWERSGWGVKAEFSSHFQIAGRDRGLGIRAKVDIKSTTSALKDRVGIASINEKEPEDKQVQSDKDTNSTAG